MLAAQRASACTDVMREGTLDVIVAEKRNECRSFGRIFSSCDRSHD